MIIYNTKKIKNTAYMLYKIQWIVEKFIKSKEPTKEFLEKIYLDKPYSFYIKEHERLTKDLISVLNDLVK